MHVGLRSLEDIMWVKWLMQPRTCASCGATSVSIVTGRHSGVGVPETELSVYSIQHVGKASNLSDVCVGHIVTLCCEWHRKGQLQCSALV